MIHAQVSAAASPGKIHAQVQQHDPRVNIAKRVPDVACGKQTLEPLPKGNLMQDGVQDELIKSERPSLLVVEL